MARKIQLETVGNRVVTTCKLDADSIGATLALAKAKIGKAVSLKAIAANSGQEGTVELCADGAAIFGRLANVSPKIDVGGVEKSGYLRLPYTGTAPAAGANDGTGFVIGGGSGAVKRCTGTPTVGELLARPLKVVSVRTSDTTCVVEFPADVL